MYIANSAVYIYLGSTNDCQWKIHVSKEILKKCWFLVHKNTYGSINYIFKLALIPYAFSVLLSLSIAVYSFFFAMKFSDIISFSQNFVLMGVPAIVTAILWHTTPDLNDSFGVIKENRIAMRIGLMLLIIYGVIVITPFLGATEFTRRILGVINNYMMQFFAGTLYTFYAIKFTKQYDQRLLTPSSISSKSADKHLTLQHIHHVLTPSTSSYSNVSVDTLMEMVLSQDRAFNEFMSHLSQEFSIELLLSFVEFVQFKAAIRSSKELVLKKDLKISAAQQTVLQNEFIPKSFVVHGDLRKVVKDFNDRYRNVNIEDVCNGDDEHDKILKQYQIRGYILYYKFIDSSSEFQVNLSDGEFKVLNQKIVNNRNDLNEKNLFVLWDGALKELWKLLRHSFYRFMKTPKYIELNIQNDH